MAESATDAKLRDLSRRLRDEKTAHAKTRNELQQEVSKVWGLVPGYYINLMGVYPPLRKLLGVLVEAANLQDPQRGAPTEDTMRTEVTELTPTERGVLSHRRHRQRVRRFTRELEHLAYRFSQDLPGTEWEYQTPDGECDECGRALFQESTGRRRRFCSGACRQRAARSV